ncbi:3002_t:CDS:1, partial [Paraglomus occultum]
QKVTRRRYQPPHQARCEEQVGIESDSDTESTATTWTSGSTTSSLDIINSYYYEETGVDLQGPDGSETCFKPFPEEEDAQPFYELYEALTTEQ